jgi:hypothetical protein
MDPTTELSAMAMAMTVSDDESHQFRLIDTWSGDVAEELQQAFGTSQVVALDAEGVDLSRAGLISLVQLYSAESKTCFILDVLKAEPTDDLVLWLKELLENSAVVKVVHDCRMDSDAVRHHLNIDLVNVHDTSCWNQELSGRVDMNLNDTLSTNGIDPNTYRDKGMYQRNPAVWATRPLTLHLLKLASGDVSALTDLHAKQVGDATTAQAMKAQDHTLEYLEYIRRASLGMVHVNNPGMFIGRGGTSLRALQNRTNTLVYGIGKRSEKSFMVFYVDIKDFHAVKRVAEK